MLIMRNLSELKIKKRGRAALFVVQMQGAPATDVLRMSRQLAVS